MNLSSRIRKLAAFCCGLLLLVVLEWALALVGVSPLSQEDRFVGFDSNSRLFVETVPGHYSLNPAKAAYFNPQSFEMPKPQGVFRIVTLGGSTTYGRPYLQQTAFGSWLGKLLERYGTSKVEVINAGGISYASYRVRRIMQEMVNYQPDLIVVYSGHNEFLEARNFAQLKSESETMRKLRGVLQHSRIYSVLTRSIGFLKNEQGRTSLDDGVSATIEKIGGPELYHRDPQFRAGVIQQYAYELDAMARLGQHRKIPLIFCSLPVNLSGVSPFKSEHRSGLTAQQIQQWNKRVEVGEQAFQRGDNQAALTAYLQAAEIDNRYALLNYRTGQALEALGRFTEAYAAYDRAREEDIVPLRALNEFNMSVKRIAREDQIPLADVEAFYRRISPGGIPGANLFDDHVHPTIEGQQIIAWSVLNTATAAGIVPLSKESWQLQQKDARAYLRQEFEAMSPIYLARGQWGVGRLFFWAGKHEEAYIPLLNAWKTIRDTPEIPIELGQIELERGAADLALRYFDAALKLSPDNEKVLLGKATSLVFSGEPEVALALIDSRQWGASNQATVWLTRGQALMLLNKPQLGVEALRKAVSLAVDVASYHKELAKGLNQAGLGDEASREYRTYLELSRAPDVDGKLLKWREQIELN